MINLFRVIQIVNEDKKFQSNGRNDRVTEINNLLGLCKNYKTKFYTTDSGNNYEAEYHRGQFWYDNKPITLKAIWDKLGYYHVWHWLVYPKGSRCGFESTIAKGRFSKKNVYDFLVRESKRIDKIIVK